MKASMDFDLSEFRRAAQKLRAVKNVTVEKLMKDQGRLFARDCLRLTPPFGPHAITESFNTQRRAGERAVARDVGRVFQPLANHPLVKSPRSEKLTRAIRKALRNKDTAALQAIFENAGFQVKILAQPDPALHQGARDRRGRVRKKFPTRLVVDARALKRFEREQVGKVGKTKAGWLAAAMALQVKGIPQWILRHHGRTPGLIRFEKSDGSFAITLGNLVAYSEDFTELRIIEAALGNRERAMRIQAEKILEHELRRAAA